MVARRGAESSSAEPNERLISIGRLAAETGVSNRTIRYYEDLGILPAVPRAPGGTRKYPPEYRFFVEGALALKELGFSLEEIRLIGRMALSEPMEESQREAVSELVGKRIESLERKIAVLTRLREVFGQRRRNRPGASAAEEFVHIFQDDPQSSDDSSTDES